MMFGQQPTVLGAFQWICLAIPAEASGRLHCKGLPLPPEGQSKENQEIWVLS